MNRVQSFLNVDERKVPVTKRELKIRAFLYCLFCPHQLKYIKLRNKTLNGQISIDVRQPWVGYDAIKKLESIVDENMNVFEYGAGGSTLYFSDKCKEVYSVENDENWYKKIKSNLPRNTKLVLHKPVKANNKEVGEYGSTRFPGMSMKSYVNEINKFPNSHFDIVLVDGRSRAKCIEVAKEKVKPGGYIILDNSEREDYQSAFRILRGWEEESCFGIGPFELLMSQTTFFKRPTTTD